MKRLLSLLILIAFAIPQANAGVWDREVTRAETIHVFLTDAGYVLEPCTGLVFPDVPVDHPYCDAIEMGHELGFVFDYHLGSFNPEGTITRAEAAKIAYLVYEIDPSEPETFSYTDVSPRAWYFTFIESLNAVGAFHITSGAWHPSEHLKRSGLRFWKDHL